MITEKYKEIECPHCNNVMTLRLVVVDSQPIKDRVKNKLDALTGDN